MRLKRKRLLPAFLAVAALLALSVAAAMTHSLLLYLLLALSVPAAVKSVPAFKGRESLALFIVGTVVGLPINLAAARAHRTLYCGPGGPAVDPGPLGCGPVFLRGEH